MRSIARVVFCLAMVGIMCGTQWKYWPLFLIVAFLATGDRRDVR